jgi:AcrR family transcriptional regulator
MGTAERDAQREDLRERIVEGARDIVGEEGLDALSMRALGLRVGCSPATIYLHFRDKDELLRSVVVEGSKRLDGTVREEVESLEGEASPVDRLAATARGYARFALENTGYFRALFRMPAVARMDGCPATRPEGVVAVCGPVSSDGAVALARHGRSEGSPNDLDRVAVVGWGLMHGLTSLYLSGHLAGHVGSREEFMELIESAISVMRAGWKA